MAEITVYFNSGHKARMDSEKTIIADKYTWKLEEAVEEGFTVVNWANVSFIRKAKDPEATDDAE